MDSYAKVGGVEFRVPWVRCDGDWEDTAICVGEDEQDVREILKPGLEADILETAYLDLHEQIRNGKADLQIKAAKEAATWREVNDMAHRCINEISDAIDFSGRAT